MQCIRLFRVAAAVSHHLSSGPRGQAAPLSPGRGWLFIVYSVLRVDIGDRTTHTTCRRARVQASRRYEINVKVERTKHRHRPSLSQTKHYPTQRPGKRLKPASPTRSSQRPTAEQLENTRRRARLLLPEPQIQDILGTRPDPDSPFLAPALLGNPSTHKHASAAAGRPRGPGAQKGETRKN